MSKRLMLTLAVSLALVVGIMAFWLSRGDSPVSRESQTQTEAIEQARDYKPEGMLCGAVLTPAVHQATGARYTFPDSCIAPGWEAEH